MNHNVFTDLPPEKLGCFGNQCVIGIIGPHKCPIGRCQCHEDAIIADLKAKGRYE